MSIHCRDAFLNKRDSTGSNLRGKYIGEQRRIII